MIRPGRHLSNFSKYCFCLLCFVFALFFVLFFFLAVMIKCYYNILFDNLPYLFFFILNFLYRNLQVFLFFSCSLNRHWIGKSLQVRLMRVKFKWNSSLFNDIPPHQPRSQASSSPIPRIQIWSIVSLIFHLLHVKYRTRGFIFSR